jgi:hypothetical protein
MNSSFQPSLSRGWDIFASRPLSLIVALILVIVVSVISFMLLFFPAVAGYYYAVSQSRREEYFIDLNNVFRTSFLVFRGIGRYLLSSYVLGLVGLLPAMFLYVCPILPYVLQGDEGLVAGIFLQILWIPAFFLTGAVVFYGFPHLIESNSGIASFGNALSAGKARPLNTFGRGFLLLSPLPGALVHFFMVFSYPILVAWAVATTGDTEEIKREISVAGRASLGKLLFGLVLAAVMFGVIYVSVLILGGVGLFIGLGISFILAFLFASKLQA